MAATTNTTDQQQNYILSVKLALDPEIKAATETLARMRKELDGVARDLKKASTEFASQGGDATAAAAALKRYNETLRGTKTAVDQTSSSLVSMKDLGLNAMGEAFIRLAPDVKAAMRAIDAPVQQSKASMEGWRASLAQLEVQMSTLPTKLEIVRTKLAQLDKANEKGTAAWKAYISELKRLENEQRQLDSVLKGTSANAGNMRFQIQNVAFQLQDIMVQAQMGTKASVIIAQQVPQILGAFGPWGAVAGVVVAVAASIAGPFVDSLISTQDPLKEMKDGFDDLNEIIDKFGQVNATIDTQKMRKEFNDASTETRKLMIAQMDVQAELIKTQHSLNQVNFQKFVDNMMPALTGMDHFSRRLRLMFSGLGGEDFENADKFEAQTQLMKKAMDEYGVSLAVVQEIQAALRSGGEAAIIVFEKYGAALAKGTPKAQEAAKQLSISAQEQMKYNKAVKEFAQTREEANKAMETGGKMAVEDHKKTKERKQAQKDLNDEFAVTRDIFMEMAKIATPAFEGPVRAEIIQKNIATWQAWGITQDQIIKKLEDADEAARRAIGTWSAYDDAQKELTKTTRDLQAYHEAVAQVMEEFSNSDGGEVAKQRFEGMMNALAKLNPALKDTKQSAKELEDEWQIMGVAIGTVLGNSIDGLLDVLLTSEKSFKDWAASVIAEIGKVLIKLALLQAAKTFAQNNSWFADFFGMTTAAHGASFYGPTSLQKNTVINRPTPFLFAHGGTFGASGRSLRSGLAGEAGPEAIVPLQRTAGGDLGVAASPVNIMVYNTVSNDTKVDVAENQKADGSREISITVRRELKAALSDGSMDQSLRTNYGMTRRAI